MGGIWTALSACRAEWALTASCDIPAVRQSFFLKLLDSRSEDVDIVCPVTSDGRMHMTCALYRRSAALLLEARLREGNYRMRSLFSCCRVKTVPVTDPEEERMLSNINTPEELDRVRGRHD
jgi:molybdopterin-guanine dinucleotide biosynthesis protein A